MEKFNTDVLKYFADMPLVNSRPRIDEDVLVAEVVAAIKRGNRLILSRDHNGRFKIKLKCGPFHLFSRVFSTDTDLLDKIKTQLERGSCDLQRAA